MLLYIYFLFFSLNLRLPLGWVPPGQARRRQHAPAQDRQGRQETAKTWGSEGEGRACRGARERELPERQGADALDPPGRHRPPGVPQTRRQETWQYKESFRFTQKRWRKLSDQNV